MSLVHRMLRGVSIWGFLPAGLGLAACTHLPPFGADLGKQLAGHHEVRVPYAATVRHFGWVALDAPPDEIRDGKKMFYLYAWIPGNTSEVGVRMVSPARLAGAPVARIDSVEPGWAEHKSMPMYFDTWVRFERCLAAINLEDVTKPCQQWVSLGDNDDSDELPPNPSGQRYNSVLRVASSGADPLKALVRGMYRIAFTSSKVGQVQGTFMAEIGSVTPWTDAALTRTPETLAILVSQRSAQLSTAAPAEAQASDEGSGESRTPTWEQ